MGKRWLALMGCMLVMGAALSGCGKAAGSIAGNRDRTEEAPNQATNKAGGNSAGTGALDENGVNGVKGVSGAKDGEDAKEDGGRTDGDGGNPKQNAAGSKETNTVNAVPSGEGASGTTVTQKGPFGSISLTVPAGWKYELCPMDSDSLLMGDYGIYFAPEDADFGFVEVAYWRFFGVCGTGLAEEEVTVAGNPVWKGTYDGHEYWDFISFKEPMRGVVAMTSSVEEWWEGNEAAVMEILDTLVFDPAAREGSACIYKNESENEQIGLHLSLEGISSTGATLCYSQYDKDAPTGQLQDGDDFAIEVKKDGKWEEAPIAAEGNYGFHDIAYTISPGDTTRRELNWEWLYGELAPGEYRIRKRVTDFRGTGDYDQYDLYADFILN